MKTVITNPIIRFNSGEVEVIILPEEPEIYPCVWEINECPMRKNGFIDCECKRYQEACAYARAHPIDVDEKNVDKIELMIWNSSQVDHTEIKFFPNWQPKEHTEYKLEVKMEIKIKACSDCNAEGLHLSPDCCGEFKQIACLIEDDKPIPIKSENPFGLKELEDDKQ